MELQGRAALVTGGASGIGKATATLLQSLGARVAIADLDEERGAAVAAELGCPFVVLDVTDRAAWTGAMNTAVAALGGLDIVHLNAGVLTPRGPGGGSLMAPFDVVSLTDAQYDAVTAINIGGVVFGTRAAARAMPSGGVIVVTASMAALVPMPSDPVYSATKHATLGFVRSAAPGLIDHGIRIQAVCPGFVQTPIADPRAFDKLREAGLGVMEPEHVAEAVVHAIRFGETGGAFVVLAGREPTAVAFADYDMSAP